MHAALGPAPPRALIGSAPPRPANQRPPFHRTLINLAGFCRHLIFTFGLTAGCRQAAMPIEMLPIKPVGPVHSPMYVTYKGAAAARPFEVIVG